MPRAEFGREMSPEDAEDAILGTWWTKLDWLMFDPFLSTDPPRCSPAGAFLISCNRVRPQCSRGNFAHQWAVPEWAARGITICAAIHEMIYMLGSFLSVR